MKATPQAAVKPAAPWCGQHSWCFWTLCCPCTQGALEVARCLKLLHGGKAPHDCRGVHLKIQSQTFLCSQVFFKASRKIFEHIFLNLHSIQTTDLLFFFFQISFQSQSGWEHFLMSAAKSGSCVGTDLTAQHRNTL